MTVDLPAILNQHAAWLSGQVGACANLTRANLTSANLAGANLRSANLTIANLTSANLTSANLAGANLTGANLVGADLAGANLTGANLTSADLVGADLAGADLAGANLRGANLTGARIGGNVYANHAATYASTHGEAGRQLLGIRLNNGATLFWCGCFHGDANELTAYIFAGKACYRSSRTLAMRAVLSMLDNSTE